MYGVFFAITFAHLHPKYHSLDIFLDLTTTGFWRTLFRTGLMCKSKFPFWQAIASLCQLKTCLSASAFAFAFGAEFHNGQDGPGLLESLNFWTWGALIEFIFLSFYLQGLFLRFDVQGWTGRDCSTTIEIRITQSATLNNLVTLNNSHSEPQSESLTFISVISRLTSHLISLSSVPTILCHPVSPSLFLSQELSPGATAHFSRRKSSSPPSFSHPWSWGPCQSVSIMKHQPQ